MVDQEIVETESSNEVSANGTSELAEHDIMEMAKDHAKSSSGEGNSTNTTSTTTNDLATFEDGIIDSEAPDVIIDCASKKREIDVKAGSSNENASQSVANGPPGGPVSDQVLEIAAGISDETISRIISSSVSSATLLSNAGSEMSFQLPMDSSSSFAPMLERLDVEVDKGSIGSYGVSITTLDEVFLLVARGETGERPKLSSSRRQADAPSPEYSGESNRSRNYLWSDDPLFTRHLRALFLKRLAFFRRDRKAWFCTTFLPSIFVCIGFLIYKYAAPERNLGPITLDLAKYNDGIVAEPRNPIIFNSQENPFLCQPGVCSYQMPVVYQESTNELYFFCGYQSRFFDLDSLPSDPSELSELSVNQILRLLSSEPYNCTIAESEGVADRIIDDGASAQPSDVENIKQVRQSS